MPDYAARRNRLLESIDADAFLVADLDRLLPSGIDQVSLFYLTGYTGEGVLIVREEDSILLTDYRYLPRAEAQGSDLRIVLAEGDYLADIAAQFDPAGTLRLAVSGTRMTHGLIARLQGIPGIAVIPVADPVATLRQVKDADEVARIKEAVALTEACLADLLEAIRPGMTEAQIAARLEIGFLERGAEKAFDPLIATGENSVTGHHEPGDRIVERGDFLLFDIGARLCGYCADMTRTVAVGTASTEMERIYASALAANRAGIAALKAGNDMQSVHDAIARAIAQSAYPGEGRIAGHGLGLEVHEHPKLSAGRDVLLQPGMVMTMEPGTYIPGLGGVRIEDVVLITESGSEALTTFPKDELLVIG